MNEGTKKLLDNIKKNVKGMNVTLMSDSTVAVRKEYIKTPSLDLNRILSGDLFKGIPEKTMVGITGPEHSFKSSFAVLCAADAIKRGYTPVVIDTEGGITADFCTRWGLDINNAIYTYDIWIENIIPLIANLKDSGMKKMVIILDSIGGLDREKTYNDAMKDDIKSDQGQLQKAIRTLLKLLAWVCVETDSIAIYTAHLMSKPGLIPMPDDVSGGKAVKLFPSIFIFLKKASMKKDDKQTGNLITATTMKNRFYPPFQMATIDIDYNKGINPVAGLLELMLPDKANLLKKEGNTYYYVKNKEKFATYDHVAEQKLNVDYELLDELNTWLKTTGYSTVNENVKAAEEMVLETEEVEETEVETKPKSKVKKEKEKAKKKKRR